MKVLFPAQTSNYLSNISQPLTPFDCSTLKQSSRLCVFQYLKDDMNTEDISIPAVNQSHYL